VHAFKVYTRNKRIKRILQRKAQSAYERNLLLRVLRAWSARTAYVNTHSLRLGNADGTQFVRLKGNIGEWQRALRTPLRSVSALAFPDISAEEFAFRNFSKSSDLAVDQDNRLYRRVVANNSSSRLI